MLKHTKNEIYCHEKGKHWSFKFDNGSSSPCGTMEFKKGFEEGDLKSSPDSTLHELPTHSPKTVEMKWENDEELSVTCASLWRGCGILVAERMSLVVNVSWNVVFLESYGISSREVILLFCLTVCLKQDSLLKHHSRSKEYTTCEKLCPHTEKPTWRHGVRRVTMGLTATPQPLLSFLGVALCMGSVQRLAAWVESVGWCHGNLFSEITMEVNPYGVPSANTGKPKTPGRRNLRNHDTF